MMTFEDRKALERCYAKAQQLKPKAHEVSYGVYSVAGSKGDSYTVTFKKVQGKFQGECSCAAHTKSASPRMCYHLVSVLGHMTMRIKEKAAQKAATLVELSCPKCGETYQTENSGQFFCTPCEEADRRAKVAVDFADLFGAI